jgi:hypothetical protein
VNSKDAFGANEQVQGLGDINWLKPLPSIPRTVCGKQQATRFPNSFWKGLSLYGLRPGESADVMVMLRVLKI